MEGDRPTPRGDLAQFRIEVMLPDAVTWAEALQPFVENDESAPAYAVAPPWNR